MIDPVKLTNFLKENNAKFFTGVADSTLKGLISHFETLDAKEHVVAANEGAAVALATGYHLATGGCPIVYMQNSGLGNAVNPLLSLAAKECYSVPMVILIGWRGCVDDGKDEPQHVLAGGVMTPMLDAMRIHHVTLPAGGDDTVEGCAVMKDAIARAMDQSCPVAVLCRKKTLDTIVTPKPAAVTPAPLTRDDGLRAIIAAAPEAAAYVATTGFTSRELYALRETLDAAPVEEQDKHEVHRRDFLCVGSMGHCSAIATGLAIHKPDVSVVCLDGDGAAVMHMGSMATAGKAAPANLRHVVFDNGSYESTGGQQSGTDAVDLAGVMQASGYTHVATVSQPEDLEAAVAEFVAAKGPAGLVIKCRCGVPSGLPRPSITPVQCKGNLQRFMGV